MWIVFCVHDDTEAFLEAYVDNKTAVLHKPEWFVPLNFTRNISPTICPQEQEYVFVITLPTENVRLAAPSWDHMLDWVECLRGKLVELKVLTPKENLYSKLPAEGAITPLSNANLLPTRDPTSPLPPPPAVPPAHLPGVDATPSHNIRRHADLQRGISLPNASSPNHSSGSSVTIIQLNGEADNNDVFNFDVRRSASASNNSYDSVFNFPPTQAAQAPTLDAHAQSPGILQPAPQPYKTLREQQVLQLQSEMQHPGGVRLQIRRRDCMSSIALADALDAVWICGWNQKEHPILYNTLHIGDRLVSVEGIVVQSANDVHQVLRSIQSRLFVSVVVRRVPFGRIFVLHREVEGQSLGLVQDGNTATLASVVENGLAARQGLPFRARTCDGRAWTRWVLTEINGRPLNLFFKETEVRDRLNAVGRDISILVQPLDLIKQLKKQLKTMRNYKDYILQ